MDPASWPLFKHVSCCVCIMINYLCICVCIFPFNRIIWCKCGCMNVICASRCYYWSGGISKFSHKMWWLFKINSSWIQFFLTIPLYMVDLITWAMSDVWEVARGPGAMLHHSLNFVNVITCGWNLISIANPFCDSSSLHKMINQMMFVLF